MIQGLLVSMVDPNRLVMRFGVTYDHLLWELPPTATVSPV